jgi:hypothetical protein
MTRNVSEMRVEQNSSLCNEEREMLVRDVGELCQEKPGHFSALVIEHSSDRTALESMPLAT